MSKFVKSFVYTLSDGVETGGSSALGLEPVLFEQGVCPLDLYPPMPITLRIPTVHG